MSGQKSPTSMKTCVKALLRIRLKSSRHHVAFYNSRKTGRCERSIMPLGECWRYCIIDQVRGTYRHETIFSYPLEEKNV